MFMMIHNVAQLSNKFLSWHQGLLMEFFSSSVHFDLVERLSFRAGIVPDVMRVL